MTKSIGILLLVVAGISILYMQSKNKYRFQVQTKSNCNLHVGDKGELWDIDHDNLQDFVELDTIDMKVVIVCKLSSQNYTPIKSQEIENYDNNYISLDNAGFSYHNDWMRAGYSCDFAYDEDKKRIRLTEMNEYAFGNAANDGSGDASINLLTGKYIGDWNYLDNETNELIAIPTIEEKILFRNIFLEDFSDASYFDFSIKSAEFYQKYKIIDQKSRK